MATPKHSVLDPVDIARDHHNWTAQQSVTPAIVSATGGTYAIAAPVREEKEEKGPETPKRSPGRPRKTKK